MNVQKTLQEIFRETFDDDDLVIERSTSASDIEDWDSLAQINLIGACEKAFKLKFSIEEIVVLEDVGGMLDLIEGKLKQ